jgi:hypothetical protein
MKHHPILRASIVVAAFAIISGCSTTNTTDVTSVQPVGTGTIIGTVTLHEMDCNTSASSAGVTVAILGTTFTAVSDSVGTFTFDSVPAGYYSFQFSKPGFTTYVQSSVPFVGSGIQAGYVNANLVRINNWKTTLSTPTVAKIPDPPPYALDSEFQFHSPSGVGNVLDSSGNLPNLEYGQILLYFSKSPAINYMDTATYFATSSGTVTGNNYVYLYPNSSSTYPHDGDTVYVVGYPVSECYGSQYKYMYYIGDSLKTGYAGNGPPSNTLKLVLP